MEADNLREKGLDPSRRAFLKKGATAMPVVLTLQSGAALARSSNLIGAAPAGTTDLSGNTLCLDTSSVYPIGGKYDLGEPPYARVNVIPDRRYVTVTRRGMQEVSETRVCGGGTYFYREGGIQRVNLPANGIVVSATALSSVSIRGGVVMTEI